FHELGYRLKDVRQDWSAEIANGVCITIWKRRMNWDELSYDTREHTTFIDAWSSKSGNQKRIAHARKALDEFDGWIDAILISGEPGVSYEDAQIWEPSLKGWETLARCLSRRRDWPYTARSAAILRFSCFAKLPAR